MRELKSEKRKEGREGGREEGKKEGNLQSKAVMFGGDEISSHLSSLWAASAGVP